MLAGGIIAWNIAIPIYSRHFLQGSALAASVAALAPRMRPSDPWSQQIRFSGVGAMLVGGVWTLVSIARLDAGRHRSGLAATRRARASAASGARIADTERDLPMKYVLGRCARGHRCRLMLMYRRRRRQLPDRRHR